MILIGRAFVVLLLAFVSGGLQACEPGKDGPDVAPTPEYTQVARVLEPFIRHEMESKGLPALSVALVDDQEIVWARGFGLARPEDSVPATAETVYRVGSVSKLFTDLAVMKLWEEGDLNLDAPVTAHLPDFRPANPFGSGLPTLRQMMAHRSGLVREPPVGNYFDDSGTSLEEMVRSLNGTTLVYPPAQQTKYSNAAIATVGYALQVTQNEPFASYVKESVLEPLGMERSAFEPESSLTRDLAAAAMWTYHGVRFAAPTFQLGMAPAGSMYSTVKELARFLSALFGEGRRPEGTQVIRSATLDTMWTPQFDSEDYGIGFRIDELEGRRMIGHGGAIYGFATELAALPEEKLGVVAVTTLDGANTVVSRIGKGALRAMLAVRTGEEPVAPFTTDPLPAGLADRLAGRYGTGEDAVDLVDDGDRLFLYPLSGPLRLELRARGDTLIADDPLSFGLRILPRDEGMELEGRFLARRTVPRPAPPPERWQELIGEYGWDHNVLYLLEKEGHLHALIEWFYEYPLTEAAPDTFDFPETGLYEGERLIVHRGPEGEPEAVEAGTVLFPRRNVGAQEGETFRIEPVRPVDSLRAEALAATPPVEEGSFQEPDLVEVTELDPTIRKDIRYATTNNFMGAKFYEAPEAFMQRPAAEALVRVHRALQQRGFGLLIFDAYRPWFVTKMFFDATPEEQKIFVADPRDGSRHNRGCAVDLTLYELATGEPVSMVAGYDEFSPRSYPLYPGGTSRQRWHREVLRDAMERGGFTVYEAEWWHYDYKDWREYPILNQTFEGVPQTDEM